MAHIASYGRLPDARENNIPLKKLQSKNAANAIIDVEEFEGGDSERSNFNGFRVNDEENVKSRWRWRQDFASKARRTEKGSEPKEEPKVLLSNNFVRAILHFVLFHTVPIGVALALIGLNTKTHYFGTSGKWVGAFQFAAKAHEIFMQFSITTVMTAFLQRLLVHQRPIPFGAIFSAYQVTQMSYLWSPEFRAALTAAGFDGATKAAFILVVPLSILMAAGVGPSSAIAMQPRPVNFTLPNIQYVLNVTSDALYPDRFDLPGPPLVFNNVYRNERSPAAGWQYLDNLPAVGGDPSLYNGLYQPTAAGGITDTPGVETGLQNNMDKELNYMPELYSTKISTFGDGWRRSVARTLYIQYAPNSTFATVQSVPVAIGLSDTATLFSQFPKGGVYPGVADIEMGQAVVSAYCVPNPIMGQDDDRPYLFPTTYVTGCKKDGCSDRLNEADVQNYTAISRQDILNQWEGESVGRIIWIENMKAAGSTQDTALGAVVVHNEQCFLEVPYLMTSACMIGAVWVNTTSSLEFSEDGPMIAGNQLASDWFSVLSQWSQPSPSFSKAWAESLSPMTDVQNRSVVDNLLHLMPATSNVCPLNGTYTDPLDPAIGSTSRPFMHERLLASLVANGMSHAAGAVDFWYPDPDKPNNWITFDNPSTNEFNYTAQQPEGVSLTFRGWTPGYGWNLDGIPIKIALPILALYCAYALSYGLYTLITGRSSNTWRSISDLFALAINSTPTSVLENTSCGVGLTDTYRKLVSIREVEDHQRLELVFKQDEGEAGPTRRVVVGRKY